MDWEQIECYQAILSSLVRCQVQASAADICGQGQGPNKPMLLAGRYMLMG